MRKMPNWCMNAKIAMVKRGLTVTDVARKLGLTRVYVSSVLNGRVYTSTAVKRISDFLEISDDYDC